MGVTLYTLGHSNHTQPDLLALLHHHGLCRVVDVRSRPASKRHPWFNRGELEAALTEGGLDYRWQGRDLGGLRKLTAAADDHPALATPGLRAYAAYMTTPRFQQALARLLALAAEQPTAVLCAERDFHQCHRALLADAVVTAGGRVLHLQDQTPPTPHARNPAARRDRGGRLVYDRGTQPTLGLD